MRKLGLALITVTAVATTAALAAGLATWALVSTVG